MNVARKRRVRAAETEENILEIVEGSSARRLVAKITIARFMYPYQHQLSRKLLPTEMQFNIHNGYQIFNVKLL